MNAALKEQAVAAVRSARAARGPEAPQLCTKAIAACEAAGVTAVQICRELAEQDRADYRAYLIAISGGGTV
jgi:hypothetical protein